jgi:hypothetical protein
MDFSFLAGLGTIIFIMILLAVLAQIPIGVWVAIGIFVIIGKLCQK